MDWKDPKPAPEPLALVQDFVNTRHCLHGTDLLATAADATALLTQRGLLTDGERLGESDRQDLLAFREGLRGLLLAHNSAADRDGGSGADARALAELVGRVCLRVAFGPDDRPTLEPDSEGAPVDRVLGRMLAVIATAEAVGDWRRLKACRNERCLWAFYDASKNRSGRWCDMNLCGVRHKMRAYRKRKTESK